MKILLFVTFLFTAIAVSSAAERLSLKEAPDNSLTLQDYIALGVPRTTKAWDGSDFEAALKALAELAKTDVTKLPRISSSSHSILRKFTDLAGVPFTPQTMNNQRYVGSLLNIYVLLGAKNNYSFTEEQTQLCCTIIPIFSSALNWAVRLPPILGPLA